MLKASIIIPTFNRCNYLKRTLESLVKLIFPPDGFEVLICDNGSTDNTAKIVKEMADKFKFHNIHYFFEDVPGSLAARHRGFHESQSDNILIFTDDDVLLSPDWLMTIINTFEQYPEIDMVGGPSLPIYEAPKPAWLNYFYQDDIETGCFSTDYSLLHFPVEKMFEVDPGFIWSLNLAVRKQTFITCGGLHLCVMPKEYQHFQGDGETGFTMKFAEMGYKAVYHPQVQVKHIIPSDRMTFNFLDNRYFYGGVCASYTNIRRKYGLYTKNSFLKKGKGFAHGIINRLLRVSQESVSKGDSFGEALIRKRCACHYQSGYNFHQWAVKNNPELLKWVLKEDYFDYKLPEL